MLVLLLVGVIAVGAVGLHYWTQKDVLIHRALSDKLATMFPTCDVSFQNVQIANTSSVVVTELLFRSKSDETTLAKVPRLTLHLDGQLFEESKRILVKKLELDSPQVFAVKSPDGSWNWSDFRKPEARQKYSATVVIKNGEFQVGLQSTLGGPIRSVSSTGIELKISPEARQRYLISGNAIVDSLGPVALNGLIDSRTNEWKLTGQSGTVRVDESLIEQTGQWIPEVATQLARLRSSPQYLARHQGNRADSLIRSASNGNVRIPSSAARNLSVANNESFVRADVQLNFSVGQASKESPLDYLVTADIEHGQVSDLFLPIPLYDVHAKIELSPSKITIGEFRAANNQSSLFIDGVAQRVGGDWSKQFVVRASNLQIDERIQSILTEDLLKLYRLTSPSGIFDLDFNITQQPQKPLNVKLRKFTARDCRVVHDFFRYPVENIHGAITHAGGDFVIEMTGTAGKRPVTLNGSFGDGTLDRDADYTITVKNLPIDDQFSNGFGRPEQAGIKEAINALRLSGVIDFTGRFLKNAQTHDQFKMQLVGDVRESTLNFVGFPYEFQNFSGRIQYDGLKEDVWQFRDLKAGHGHALFSGNGVLDRTVKPGVLGLELGVVRVPIDSDLEKASLASAPHLAPLWTDFALAGTLDIEKVVIGWRPGSPTQVKLKGIQWRDGTIKPVALPYQWDNVVGALDWDGKRIHVHSLNGWHDKTYLHIDGTDPDWPTFVEIPSSGPVAWEVHFGNLGLTKVKFDEELERALPEDLASTLKAMNLQGHVDLQLRVDLKGWVGEEEIVTAKWVQKTFLENNSLFAGIPLSNVTGKVNISNGVWDGQKLRMEGYLELDKATALEMSFRNIRSPFHVQGDRLVVGTPKFIDPQPQYLKPNLHTGKQLRAEIYSGQIGFDSLVVLAERPELTQYKAEVNVSDVELAEWASDQFKNARRLNGKVNGIVGFQGMGPSTKAMTGKGWVNIVPAAIMELPAFAQMFAVMNFRPVGNTAFNYAYGDFDIKNGLLDFSRIELRGDALGLIGKGNVGFASGGLSLINLTFDSRANNRLPVLGPIIQRFGNNWIRVKVVGPVKNPEAIIQTRIGPLDDAFREFTDAIEKGQNRRPPVRVGGAERPLQ